MSTILTIEDDENFRRAIIKYVGKRGFQVMAAANGHEGLVKALENPPDLIVCDLVMPGMDGFEVLAALRKEDRLASIPVIFLTGRAEPGQVREGMNLGADDYLTKPLDLADLVKAIEARLARRQSEKTREEKQMQRAMQLFSGIMHDLRDPLFVVLGCADKLRVGAMPSEKVIEQMYQMIERMQSIVSQTMFLIRSRMQRLPFDLSSFDLRESCRQLLADHEQSRRLRFKCDSGKYPIVGDSLRLRQAMENLLSNALKYSDGIVSVRLRTSMEGYLLEVKDQGIGIPIDEQERVFEPFFRASNVANRPGHGVELAIVKANIEQHGGRISIASDAHKGTTVSIELPASPPKSPPAPAQNMSGHVFEQERSGEDAPSEPDAKSSAIPLQANVESSDRKPQQEVSEEVGGHLTAIIVDDEPLVRGVLRDFLEKSEDITVLGEAGNLAQARLLTKQQSPNVVFLDAVLPDGLGFDLLPDLRTQTSVVFVTSTEEYAVQAFDCEAVDYLLKPVSYERLQKALLRVRKRLAANGKNGLSSNSKLEETFLVKTIDEKRLVKIGEITRILAYGEYSWVYWSKSKGALLRKSLKQWLLELPGDQFVRVHRRAIVNLAAMEHIEKLPGGRMQMFLRDTNDPIRVSLRLSPNLNRKLRTFHG
jgi:DNA-binding LytR/AlgR family response regulator